MRAETLRTASRPKIPKASSDCLVKQVKQTALIGLDELFFFHERKQHKEHEKQDPLLRSHV